MKKTLTLIVSLILLSGCSTMADQFTGLNELGSHVERTSTKEYAQTDPAKVQIFYGDNKPARRYTVIGNLTVTTDNFIGANRNEADIVKDVKEKAASIGGDAVINATRGMTTINGTVIRYNKR